jgi:hypothetical protein
MTEVSPQVRQGILRYASDLTTTRSDPVSVAVNAAPLLAWLEDAADEHDQDLRRGALRQHWANACLGSGRDEAVSDNPDEFLRAARVLYAFTVAAGGA